MDIETSWQIAQLGMVGRPISVMHDGFETKGIIEEVSRGEQNIEIVISNPHRRTQFSGGAFVPAPFNILCIENTRKVFKIENGSKLYILLPRAGHATVG
jgi:hypothetical protein